MNQKYIVTGVKYHQEYDTSYTNKSDKAGVKRF